MLTRYKKRKRNEIKMQDVLYMTKELFLLLLDAKTIQMLLICSQTLHEFFYKKWKQRLVWDLNYLKNKEDIRKIEFEDTDIYFKCIGLSEDIHSKLLSIMEDIRGNKRNMLLPENTISLQIKSDYYLIENIPPKLEILNVGLCYFNLAHIFSNELPQNLIIFKCKDVPKFEKPLILPPKLEVFDFEGSFNQEFSFWPSSLTVLALGMEYNHKLGVGILPSSLTILKFGYNYQHIFENDFFLNLQSLKTLKIPTFNQEFDIGFFPSNLIKLDLGQRFNFVLKPKSLPSKLQYLQFYFGKNWDDEMTSFNQIIDYDVLPTSLTSLDLGNGYKQAIKPNILSMSLKRLSLGDENKHNILPSIIMYEPDRHELFQSLTHFLSEFRAKKREVFFCAEDCFCEDT